MGASMAHKREPDEMDALGAVGDLAGLGDQPQVPDAEGELARVAVLYDSGRVAVAGAGGAESLVEVARTVQRLWQAATMAADKRGASLDHVVVTTSVGMVAIVRHGTSKVAAVGRPGVAADIVAYRLRRLAESLPPAAARAPETAVGDEAPQP